MGELTQDQRNELDARLPEITQTPRFDCRVPKHLLASATESERYMIQAVDIAGQKQDWFIQVVIRLNHEARRSLAEQFAMSNDVEEFKRQRTFFTGGWAVAAWAGGVIMAAILAILAGGFLHR